MNNSGAAFKTDVVTSGAEQLVSAPSMVELPSVSLFKTLAVEKKYDKLYSMFERHFNFIDSNMLPLSENMTRSDIDMYIEHVNYKKAMYRVALKRFVLGTTVASLSVVSILAFILSVVM